MLAHYLHEAYSMRWRLGITHVALSVVLLGERSPRLMTRASNISTDALPIKVVAHDQEDLCGVAREYFRLHNSILRDAQVSSVVRPA